MWECHAVRNQADCVFDSTELLDTPTWKWHVFFLVVDVTVIHPFVLAKLCSIELFFLKFKLTRLYTVFTILGEEKNY